MKHRSLIFSTSFFMTIIIGFLGILPNFAVAQVGSTTCPGGNPGKLRVHLCVTSNTLPDGCDAPLEYWATATEADPLISIDVLMDDNDVPVLTDPLDGLFEYFNIKHIPLTPGIHTFRIKTTTTKNHTVFYPENGVLTYSCIGVRIDAPLNPPLKCDPSGNVLLDYGAVSSATNPLRTVQLIDYANKVKMPQYTLNQPSFDNTYTLTSLAPGAYTFGIWASAKSAPQKFTKTSVDVSCPNSQIDLNGEIHPDCPIGGGLITYTYSANASNSHDPLSSIQVFLDDRAQLAGRGVAARQSLSGTLVVNLSSGDHTFRLTATSQNGSSNEKILIVTCGNSLPDAIDDVFYMNQDTSRDISKADFLANDVDPDGDILTVTEFNPFPPGIGTWVDHGDGSYTYTPPPGFVGSLTGTYSINDGHGGIDTANAVLYVQAVATQVPPPTQPPAIIVPPTSEPPTLEPPTAEPPTAELVNQPPVANADSFTVQAGGSITVSLSQILGNDSDPDGDGLTIVDIHSTSPIWGHDTHNADGTITFTAPSDFTGVMTGEYTISDGHDHTASATITLTVTSP